MTPDVLERRLREWAEEYRGGRYEDLGFPRQNILARLRQHAGFAPDSQMAKRIPHGTPADEIESLIIGMLTGMFRQAWCLRIEYLRDDLPIEAKLEILDAIGLRMSRGVYYEQLRIGRAYLLGALNERRRKSG